MENVKNPSPEGYIDVRYNSNYSISMMLLTIVFVAAAIFWIGKDWVDKILFIIIGFVACMHGIYALLGKKYLRYDPGEKRIIFFGLFGLVDRKVRYDRLYFVGKDLYRKINGKTRFINIIKQECNKDDYEILVNEISKHQSVTGDK